VATSARVSPLRRVIRLVVLAVVAFLGVTYVALEGNDVATIHTLGDNNNWRATHVWVADAGDGSLWIEAATPDRPWLQDLRRTMNVEVDHGGTTRRWHAVVVDDPEAQTQVRALLHEKYGWADWWVGMLQDTSQSVPVRLDPR
jgi:hypothetical protein